jgi:hypothetical protein
MKPWFFVILVCWALLFPLLSLSQQASLNHPLHVAGSGPWLDRCREPASGSPTTSDLRSTEFDQARTAPLESLVHDYALTAVNMGPPGQEILGPPQSMGPWRVAGQTLQLKATIAAPFSTKLLARAIEF